MTMLASVVQTANATLNQCFQFIQDTRDHEFLFGPEVGKFIDAVYKKATELHAHVQAGVQLPPHSRARSCSGLVNKWARLGKYS